MAEKFVTFADLTTDLAVMVAVGQIRCVKEMPFGRNGTIIEFGEGHFVQVKATFDEVERALGVEF
jgi:hypothetical protein